MSRTLVLIIAILLVFTVALMTRYKVTFIRDTYYIARYDRWTGKVVLVVPDVVRK